MYKISVLSMFKNEGMIIKDWIEHYLREGIEHFYLIDNGSTDDYYEKIKIYDEYITLTKDPTRLPKGTQTYLFNKIYLQKIKSESEWIIFCDIDEYIYARNGNNQLMDALNKLPLYVEKIWLPWKCFGSNGNKNQPNNIIKSFTKRKEGYTKNEGLGKTICRTANLEKILTCGHIVQLNENNIKYNANGQKLEDYILDEKWMLKKYSLSPYADNQPVVYLRWGLGPTDSIFNLPGWNIDNIQIRAQDPTTHIFIYTTEVDRKYWMLFK